MDVQGAEEQVLKGAEKTILQNNLKIILEFWPFGIHNLGGNPERMLQNLLKLGFHYQVIDDTAIQKKGLSPEQMIKYCEGKKVGQGFVNLLFERSG